MQAFTGIGEIELDIIEDGAARWLAVGTPYPNVESLIGAVNYEAYNVYFPLLVLSGMPDALFNGGPLTDPRWFLLAAGVITLWTASHSKRAVLMVLCLPPVALDVAVGMTDLPVLALLCAGLVFADRGDGVRSGIATGLAAAMKLLAWPAVPVFLALLFVRRGLATAMRYLAAVSACLVVGLLLPALVDFRAFWANTVSLPLGFEHVDLGARTPLPGYLLASSGPYGRNIAIGLLIAAAFIMLLWLVKWPPAGLTAAAWRLGVGWTLLICLAPATRIGYFVFPITLLFWAYTTTWIRSRGGIGISNRRSITPE